MPRGSPTLRAVANLPAKISNLRSKVIATIQNVKTSSMREFPLYKCRCLSSDKKDLVPFQCNCKYAILLISVLSSIDN